MDGDLELVNLAVPVNHLSMDPLSKNYVSLEDIIGEAV